MKRFLRSHTNIVLAVFAFLLLGLVVAYFAWGVGYVFFELNEANHSQATTSPPPSFDIGGASNLNYRGISTN